MIAYFFDSTIWIQGCWVKLSSAGLEVLYSHLDSHWTESSPIDYSDYLGTLEFDDVDECWDDDYVDASTIELYDRLSLPKGEVWEDFQGEVRLRSCPRPLVQQVLHSFQAHVLLELKQGLPMLRAEFEEYPVLLDALEDFECRGR